MSIQNTVNIIIDELISELTKKTLQYANDNMNANDNIYYTLERLKEVSNAFVGYDCLDALCIHTPCKMCKENLSICSLKYDKIKFCIIVLGFCCWKVFSYFKLHNTLYDNEVLNYYHNDMENVIKKYIFKPTSYYEDEFEIDPNKKHIRHDLLEMCEIANSMGYNKSIRNFELDEAFMTYNFLIMHELYNKFRDTKLFAEIHRKILIILHKSLYIHTHLTNVKVNDLENKLINLTDISLLDYVPKCIVIFYNLIHYDIFDQMDYLDEYSNVIGIDPRIVLFLNEHERFHFDSPLIERFAHYIKKHHNIFEKHKNHIPNSEKYELAKEHFENNK